MVQNYYYMLVYKFGGATTRTARGLERMCDLIQTAHADELRKLKRKKSSGGITPGVVVVISAIGHSTRRLRSIAEDAEAGRSLFAGGTLERLIEAPDPDIAVSLFDGQSLGEADLDALMRRLRRFHGMRQG